MTPDQAARQIHDHKVNPANDKLIVVAVDNTGAGGAYHRYSISTDELGTLAEFEFQNGPISVDGNGVNGVTHEALIAIVCHRLRSFQAGQYACRENALALTKLEEAQHWLHHRTLARMQRGVEGTHAV